MKKTVILLTLIIFISSNLFSQSLKNTSISFDPLTMIGIIGSYLAADDEVPIINDNIWLSMDINWETEKQKEMGVGLFLGPHRVYLKTQYRSFYNKERQSGLFWGLYGLIEWRRMYWFYDNNNELGIGWSIPFKGRDNVYHSIGITGGFDVGFRIRMGNFGITPYIGLGIPLYLCFPASMPPQNYAMEFNVINTTLRAINIGLKLDFFIN